MNRVHPEPVPEYVFDDPAWQAAKEEAKTLLGAYAKRRQMIPYSEFVSSGVVPVSLLTLEARL